MGRITGVYIIKNIINDKIYIGSSSDSILDRWSDHKSDLYLNIHANNHLQRAWNKYGSNNFKFEILEECNENLCIIREQYYLDTLLEAQEYINKLPSCFLIKGYNINPTATSRRGAKMSKEFIKRKSEQMKGCIPWNKGIKTGPQSEKIKLKRANARRGKPHTEETKLRISRAGKGKKWSTERKILYKALKITRSKQNNEKHRLLMNKAIYQYTMDGNFIKEWESSKMAMKELKISGISAALRGIYRHAGGFTWKYKTNLS